MKFIVSSAALLKELQMLGGVINSTNTLPILDNFLFEINGNSLTLTASDLETTFSTRIAVESESNSMVALPARLLLDTLKTFPEQPLTFIKNDQNINTISNLTFLKLRFKKDINRLIPVINYINYPFRKIRKNYNI